MNEKLKLEKIQYLLENNPDDKVFNLDIELINCEINFGKSCFGERKKLILNGVLKLNNCKIISFPKEIIVKEYIDFSYSTFYCSFPKKIKSSFVIFLGIKIINKK